MTKPNSNQKIKTPATIPVPLDQCLNCGERIYQIQDTRNSVNVPKLSTAVVAFDSFVRNSRTHVVMRDALKEVFGLLYLVQLNEDSDGCALCVDCCLVFAQLYGLFHAFESRRKSDGFLGSTLKLAFKSVAAGSCVVPDQVAQEVDRDAGMEAGRQGDMETDPSDSLGVIQGISSEENRCADDNEDDDNNEDDDMAASPGSDSDQDVEMPQNVDSGHSSPADNGPVNSGPASPIENDPASSVQSEPDSQELNTPEILAAPSPPVSPGTPRTLKPKPVCIFKCIHCAKTFQAAAELATHRVKVHKTEYPFACHLCSYQTKNGGALKPHIIRHSAPWSLKCKVCKRLFRLKHNLRLHLRRKHKLTNFITEDYMEGQNPVPYLRRSTARGQTNVGQDMVPGTSQDVKSGESSKTCEKNSKKSEEDDSEDVEGNEDSRSNDGSEFRADAAFINDDKSEADSDSESSPSIASGASNASSDSENDDEESPKKSKSRTPTASKKSVQVAYKCTDCSEEFTEVSVFAQHRQIIHEISGNDTYKCHCCCKLFKSPRSLTAHLNRKAVEAQNPDMDTSNFLFECVDCSLKFKAPTALGRHRKADHGSLNLFVCHFCHYTTPYSSSLKRHVLRHIVTASSLKCPECDKYFKMKDHVKNHLRNFHKIRRIVHRPIHNDTGKPAVMLYRCKKCDKEFDSEEDLIHHRKVVHGDKEAFHCDICHALAFSKRNLKQHKMRHAAEPKHKCEHCDKTFYELISKKRHEEFVHATKPMTEKAAFKFPN